MIHPKTPFQILEGIHFLYEERESTEFDKKINPIKKIIKNSPNSLERLVNDMAVLVGARADNERYPEALARYAMHYKSFDSNELRSYLRYLCETFSIKPTVQLLNKDEKLKPYEQTLEMDRLLRTHFNQA